MRCHRERYGGAGGRPGEGPARISGWRSRKRFLVASFLHDDLFKMGGTAGAHLCQCFVNESIPWLLGLYKPSALAPALRDFHGIAAPRIVQALQGLSDMATDVLASESNSSFCIDVQCRQAAATRPRNLIEATTPPIDMAKTRSIEGSGTDWAATSAMIASAAVVGCSGSQKR